MEADTVLQAIGFAPLQVINGSNTPAGIAQGFVLLVILGLIFQPLVGMALRGSSNSVMAAALMHTFFNRSNNIDGIAADLLVGSNRPLAALIATALLTIVIDFCIQRRLSRAHRLELDAMNSETLVSSGKPSTSIGAAGRCEAWPATVYRSRFPLSSHSPQAYCDKEESKTCIAHDSGEYARRPQPPFVLAVYQKHA